MNLVANRADVEVDYRRAGESLDRRHRLCLWKYRSYLAWPGAKGDSGTLIVGVPGDEIWRAAAGLVSTRWQTFVEAEPESSGWAFASYVAALDAEEAAAADVARLYSRRAA